MMTSVASALAVIMVIIRSESLLSQSVPCSFNPLCTCSSTHRDISCAGVPFAELPSMATDDVYQLTLVGSALEVLHNDSLEGTSVSSLRLMHNSLVEVMPRAFRGTEHLLTSLDLSYNQLREMPFGALRKLHHLQWLNVHSNELEDVSPRHWARFASRSSLRSVFLGGNYLPHLHDGAFFKLDNLTTLELDANVVSEIDGRPFPPSLTTLSLSHNLLTTVPSGALQNLVKLRWLQLAGNLIRDLPRRFVLPVSRLEKLDLSHNLLTSLTAGSLNTSLTIRDLHLEFNFLRTLPARIFQGLQLERLSLANNRMSSIFRGVFEGLESTLVALDLNFNLLEKFPDALNEMRALTHLYLRGNLLSELLSHHLEGCQDALEILDLSSNRFEIVPREALRPLKRLARLSLQDNFITLVSGEDFEGWSHSLTTLSLANNNLLHLESDTFLQTPKLRELRLSFNKIVNSDSYLFAPIGGTLEVLEVSSAFSNEHQMMRAIAPLQRVEWLQVDFNRLLSVSSSALQQLPNLLHCDLEGNELKHVAPGLLKGSVHTRLRNIVLSNNDLEVVETGTFNDLPHVTNVMLFGNQLHTIYSDAFRNCSYLHTVILARNRLQYIHPGAFRNLSRLTNVFLQDNLLTEFSLDIFQDVGGSASPMYINLSNNYISALLPPENETADDDGPLLRIRTLDLSNNNVSYLPDGFFDPVGDQLFYLFLSKNHLTDVPSLVLFEVPSLQVLHLDHNDITELPYEGFLACPSLQILYLNHNNISSVENGAFKDLTNLRVLDLSYNQLARLPEDAFASTKLERINLSHNNLIRPTFQELNVVRETLRYLDVSSNAITMLPPLVLSNLLALNLSSNLIVALKDDTFSRLTQLLTLDISHNPLWRVEEYPFRPLVALQLLVAENVSLPFLPALPLPKLRTLRVPVNFLYNISESTLLHLSLLRHLDLSHNHLSDVPRHLWRHVPGLLTLNLAHNPIQVLAVTSFAGLTRLRELDIRGFDLKVVDSRTFYGLRHLMTFKTGTYPNVRAFRLHDLLMKAAALRRVVVEVEEPTLAHQLQWTFGTKLRELTVSGRNLQKVLPDAFLGTRTHELVLRLVGTSVSYLPDGLLRFLADVRYLTLDLRDNQLTTISPAVLSASDDGKFTGRGTQHITGGVMLENNPWVCSCKLLWVGQWLRRWMRETFRVHLLNVDAALHVHNLARRTECTMAQSNNTRVPVIDLKASDLGCKNNPNIASHFRTPPSRSWLLLATALLLTSSHVT